MADLLAISDDQARDAGRAQAIPATGIAYVTPAQVPSCSRCAGWQRSSAILGRCGNPKSGFNGALSSYAGRCAAFTPMTSEGP